MAAASEPEWYEKYPAPDISNLKYADKKVVAQAIRNGYKDFLVIDLRRNDYKGGRIRGALNLPAQSMYPALDDIYTLAEQAGKKNVYVHCGSSGGRATRAVGWLDEVAEKNGNTVKIYVLQGGIKGWVAGGKEYTDLMDEFDAAEW